uniref:phenylalanine--tRNA ligase n=1 Tax=Spongospora subterranea TaxID=70186 RepID=A0A0H5R911_9EUKA|eukprot:CRZ10266.1 hypothetical protein [Spongospora subterranea]
MVWYVRNPVRRLFSTVAFNAGNSVQNNFISNITPSVQSLVSQDLHRQYNHPLCTVKQMISKSFPDFTLIDQLSPIVTFEKNFDHLLIPPDHVSRQPSDTFFVDHHHVLRTHTSAHQTDLIGKGLREFLVCGDCYRRDEIDATHYPAFHQMEGVRMFPNSSSEASIVKDLKDGLETMIHDILGMKMGEGENMRWVDAYFPFTTPSFELEILYRGKWLELLGCGAIHPGVISNVRNLDPEFQRGWAFGIGLERLAMILFDIPDIRLFWSKDPRFLSQFSAGDKNVTFTPYSKYPPCIKDISFWIQPNFHENDLFAIIREVAGDLVESVSLIDEFHCRASIRTSKCYRITYRSMDRSLLNEEIDALQQFIRVKTQEQLNVTLR